MEERDKKLKVLAALAADLNESDILWAVGASAMLFLRGIVPEFREIDLIAGFVVNSADGQQHVCPLEVEEVDACVDVFEQAIALHSLQVWYKYYTWMGRTDRVKTIEEFLEIK